MKGIGGSQHHISGCCYLGKRAGGWRDALGQKRELAQIDGKKAMYSDAINAGQE